MAQPQRVEKLRKEGRLNLALSALQRNQLSSQRQAASVYNVVRTTLRNRDKSLPPQLGSRSKFRLLYESEEKALVNWILSLKQHGFPSYIINIRRLAQSLLDHHDNKRPSKSIDKN